MKNKSVAVPAVGNFSRQSAHWYNRRGFLDRPLHVAPVAARLTVARFTLLRGDGRFTDAVTPEAA